MASGRRSRSTGAIAVSAAAHALILTALALHAPTLVAPREPGGPPEPIIPLLLTPRSPPQSAGRKPMVVRLHRRPQRSAPAPPIPVLPIPPAPRVRPAPPGPVLLHPAPLPEGPRGDLRAALRAGPPGCANPEAAGLTREERARCDEAFGRGARTAPLLGLGQNDFARAAARKEADRRYRESPPVEGLGLPTRQPTQIPSDPLPAPPRLKP